VAAPPRLRVALRPIAAAFIVFGFFAGAWAVSAIDVERTFGLSDLELGLLLAAGIVAGTGVAAIGGALTDRLGARVALTRGLLAWSALLVVAGLAPNLALFAVALPLALAAGGLIDVVMNIVAADALAHEPGMLVRFHGLWNAGAVVGAVGAGVVIRLGASWRVVWIGIAVAALVTAGYVSRAHVPQPPRRDHPSMWRAVAGLRNEGLTVLAIVFAASAMVEGGIATWGVLYLRSHLQLGVLVGVTAYVVGEVLATVARVGSRGIVTSLGTRRAVALGATLASVGIAIEAVSGRSGPAAAGLAAAAVGISVVWPLLIADVNNEAEHPALAIGGVTACGYLGMVAGPPLVGLISGAFGLEAGLVVLAAVALFVAVTPAHVRSRQSV
jgi:MFS family permease